MTAEEQKQALLNATLKAGKVLIEQAGGAAGSATDEYAEFETNVSNLTNTLKAKASPAISGVVHELNDLLLIDKKVGDAALKNTKNYKDYTLAVIDQTKEQIRNNTVLQIASTIFPQLTGLVYAQAAANNTLTDVEYKLKMGLYDVTETGIVQIGMTKDAGAATEHTKKVVLDYANAMADAGQGAGTYSGYLQGLKKDTNDTKAAQDDLNASTKALANEAMAELTTAFANQKIMASLTGDALLDYMKKQGLLKQPTYDFLQDLKNITAEFDLNRDGMIDAGEATDVYKAKLDALNGLVIRNEVITSYRSIGSPYASSGGMPPQGTVTQGHGSTVIPSTPGHYEYDSHGNAIWVEGGHTGSSGSYGSGGVVSSPGIAPRASGGPVSAGQPYMVGERGPEPFIPKQDGYIAPTGTPLGNTYNIYAANDPNAIIAALQHRQAVERAMA